MANRIQNRRGSAGSWNSVNPILLEGELGLETDTGKFKFGDGIKHWADLQYATTGSGGSGGGDMSKAVYDTNGNNVVDHAYQADTVPWTGITGVNVTTLANGATIGANPTFGDSSTKVASTSFVMNAITSVNASGTGDMLKATYDPNGDGIVSQAASANFVQWTNISGRPTMSGTNTGDQTITLTGDVTGTGTGSFTATVANGAVTLAKQANLAANSIIGNNTGTAATPIAMTATQAKALLAIAQSDVTGLTAALSGLTPTSRTINGRALSADIVLQNELVQGYREKTQVSTITTVFNFTTYLASGFTSFYLTGTIGQNLTFTMPAVSAANESLSFQVFFKQPATAVTVAWGGTAPTFINGTYAAPASTKGQLLTFTSVNGSPWYGITANTADIS